MIDAWPVLTLQPAWRAPPSIYEPLKGSGAILAEFPIEDEETFNVPYMYFSTWHWLSLANGYSGFIPDSYHRFYKGVMLFPDATSLAALRAQGVTHVTINCGLGYPGCDALLEAARRSRELRPLTETQWQGGTVRLYELSGGSGAGR